MIPALRLPLCAAPLETAHPCTPSGRFICVAKAEIASFRHGIADLSSEVFVDGTDGAYSRCGVRPEEDVD